MQMSQINNIFSLLPFFIRFYLSNMFTCSSLFIRYTFFLEELHWRMCLFVCTLPIKSLEHRIPQKTRQTEHEISKPNHILLRWKIFRLFRGYSKLLIGHVCVWMIISIRYSQLNCVLSHYSCATVKPNTHITFKKNLPSYWDVKTKSR